MSQLFVSCGRSIGALASTSALPVFEYSGLISFRMDWLDLLAVHGTLKSLLHTTVQRHQFLSAQPSLWSHSLHPYMTTGRTIALTRWTFVGKGMFLLFNMLARFVIAFLPRNRYLLISWLQSPFILILEPKKIKFVTVSFVSPPICHEVMGPDAMIFVF